MPEDAECSGMSLIRRDEMGARYEATDENELLEKLRIL